MFNPFKKRKAAQIAQPVIEKAEEPTAEQEPEKDHKPEQEEKSKAPADTFTEWSRSNIRGGIERRERNDIFEAYSVFGEDGGRLTVRYFHRYPEHERDFDLSYSRALSFDEFNRRLLSELDKGDLKLGDYNSCIIKAEELSGISAAHKEYCGFDDGEISALHGFCEAMDTLTDKSYLHSDGIYRCESGSVVGNERINIWFRKLITHDAYDAETAGVSREDIAGYDIENLWIMSVYNRLYNRCGSCKVTRLRSEWSIEKESLFIIAAEGFDGIDGTLLIAVGEAESFRRFGFYSLDFSKK